LSRTFSGGTNCNLSITSEGAGDLATEGLGDLCIRLKELANKKYIYYYSAVIFTTRML
jgi:hypothetical protein